MRAVLDTFLGEPWWELGGSACEIVCVCESGALGALSQMRTCTRDGGVCVRRRVREATASECQQGWTGGCFLGCTWG